MVGRGTDDGNGKRGRTALPRVRPLPVMPCLRQPCRPRPPSASTFSIPIGCATSIPIPYASACLQRSSCASGRVIRSRHPLQSRLGLWAPELASRWPMGSDQEVPIHVGGSASASFTLENGYLSHVVYVAVAPRFTASWASSVSGRTGTAGEIDQCFRASDAGLATSAYCTSPSDAGVLFHPAISAAFFQPAQIPEGPNKGLAFVLSPAITMEMRTQIAKKWRPDGTRHPIGGQQPYLQNCQAAFGDSGPRNHYEMNLSASCHGSMTGSLRSGRSRGLTRIAIFRPR